MVFQLIYINHWMQHYLKHSLLGIGSYSLGIGIRGVLSKLCIERLARYFYSIGESFSSICPAIVDLPYSNAVLTYY